MLAGIFNKNLSSIVYNFIKLLLIFSDEMSVINWKLGGMFFVCNVSMHMLRSLFTFKLKKKKRKDIYQPSL